MRIQLYDGKTALPFGRAVLLFFKAAAARCAYYLFIKKSLPKEAFFLKPLIQFRFDLGNFFNPGRADKPFAHDDHFRRAERPQILKRVFAHDDHLRALAPLDGAGFAADSRKLGVQQSGGIERKGVAYAAEFRIVAKLPPHIVLGDVGAGGVRAKPHRNAVFQVFLRHGDDALEHNFAVFLLFIKRKDARVFIASAS